MAMIEIHPGAGTTIDRACERLVKSAPAFMLFNDIRIEADPGDTPSRGDHRRVWRRRHEHAGRERVDRAE